MSRQSQHVTRVLVAESHPLMRAGIAAALRRQPDMLIVGEVATGPEAIEACLELRPDITLMDAGLPVTDGIDATKAILSKWPEALVVMFSDRHGDLRMQRALQAGVAEYLLKSAEQEDLVDALRRIGESGRNVLVRDPEQVGTPADLTHSEIAVLRQVAIGHPNKRIALTLRMSVDTVKARLKSIMHKLSARDRTHAVTIALRRGVFDLPE